MSDLVPMMPRYEAYKDSGVAWIGEIPVDWEVKRLKFLDRINMGQSPSSEDCNTQFLGIPFLQGNAEFGKRNPSPKMWCIKPKKYAKEGDILLSVRAPVGALNVADIKIGIGRGLCAITSIESNRLFRLFQLNSSTKEFQTLSTGSTFEAISISNIKNLALPSPPLDEQTAIANFLDCKTAKIDQAVVIKEKQIQLLKERKQILIQTAVTKGFDPNVSLRDSGVEWIGEIPKHWATKRVKYLFSQSNLLIKPNDGVVTSYRDGQVTLRSNRRIGGYTEAILEQGYQGIRKGQLVLNSMDAFEGAIGVSESDGKCTPEYVICDPNSKGILPDYFAYLLREMALAKYIQVICNAVRQRAVRIRFNNLKARFLIVPPIEEQKAIVIHIQTQSTKIDQAIAIQEQMIEKLKEYKATLINSAVTGKIKVP